jgi:hypothetical protein
MWMARERRLLLWVLPAVGVFAGVILPVRFALLRFVMIITYVAAFAAAAALARGWAARPAGVRIASRALFVVVAGWCALRGLDLTWQMMADSRHRASDWLASAAQAGDRVGHVVRRSWQLPGLPPGVTAQEIRPEAFAALTAATGPAFIISMPLQDYEHAHELDFPADAYERLLASGLGYRNAGVIQTPRLFDRRPATFVNPPIRVFVREDVWQARQLEHVSSATATTSRRP